MTSNHHRYKGKRYGERLVRKLNWTKEWFLFPTKSVIAMHYFVGKYAAPHGTS